MTLQESMVQISISVKEFCGFVTKFGKANDDYAKKFDALDKTVKEYVALQKDIAKYNEEIVKQLEKLAGHSDLSEKSDHLPGVKYRIQCPACDWGVNPLLKITIIHLNDKHKWSREQIADWLESIHDPTGISGPNLNFGG